MTWQNGTESSRTYYKHIQFSMCICGFLLPGRYHQTRPPSSHMSHIHPIRLVKVGCALLVDRHLFPLQLLFQPFPFTSCLAGPRAVIGMVWPANSQRFSIWYPPPLPLSHLFVTLSSSSFSSSLSSDSSSSLSSSAATSTELHKTAFHAQNCHTSVSLSLHFNREEKKTSA